MNYLSKGKFQRPRHIDYLNAGLVDCAAGRSMRTIIQAPVRHGKSFLLSWWASVWILQLYPEWNVVLGSYDGHFAAKWGRLVRNTIDQHSGTLGIALSEDSTAAGRWETPQGGGMLSVGIGGGLTGHGMNWGVIDDPIKTAEEAHSLAYRDKVWDWFDAVFMTRCEPGARIIITMARWHEDDLIGRLERSRMRHLWRIIRLPALAEESDPLGRREGDALWPERFSRENLEATRAEKSSYYWDALYQQNPPSAGGDFAYGAYDDNEGANRDSRVELMDGLPLDLSVDFNRNPGMHAVVGQYRPFERVAIARHVLHKPRMHIKSLIGNPLPGHGPKDYQRGSLLDLLQNKYGGWDRGRWPLINLYGDATGRTEQMGDGQKYWDVLKGELDLAGIRHAVKIPSRNPGVVDRLLTFNEAFRRPNGEIQYKVHPECIELIHDFLNLKADAGGIGKKDSLFSHASDAEGYRICYILPIHRVELGGGRVSALDESEDYGNN